MLLRVGRARAHRGCNAAAREGARAHVGATLLRVRCARVHRGRNVAARRVRTDAPGAQRCDNAGDDRIATRLR